MFIVGVLVVIGIGVGVLEATGTAGLRNTTAHAITLQSPVQTAYGWFKSVNNKDYSAAVAYFEPTARDGHPSRICVAALLAKQTATPKSNARLESRRPQTRVILTHFGVSICIAWEMALGSSTTTAKVDMTD
jgi:hypothetical protein